MRSGAGRLSLYGRHTCDSGTPNFTFSILWTPVHRLLTKLLIATVVNLLLLLVVVLVLGLHFRLFVLMLMGVRETRGVREV